MASAPVRDSVAALAELDALFPDYTDSELTDETEALARRILRDPHIKLNELVGLIKYFFGWREEYDRLYELAPLYFEAV